MGALKIEMESIDLPIDAIRHPGIAIPVAPKELSLSCAVDVNESPREEALAQSGSKTEGRQSIKG